MESPISPSSFLLGDEGGDGIDHDDVEGIGADEGLADAERFFAAAGLGDEEFIHIHAELFRVERVERVLDVDEGGKPAALLRLGDEGEGQRRFTRAFRTENLDDATARKTTHAKGAIDENVAGGNRLDIHVLVVAELHDRALAVVLRDLLDGEVEVLVAGDDELVFGGFFFGFGGHGRDSF
ncbi:MAG: hypothetical protein QM796_16845 [Chthoniobacteraceae bacterium]